MPDRKNRVEAVTHASTQGDSTFSLRDPACSFRSGLRRSPETAAILAVSYPRIDVYKSQLRTVSAPERVSPESRSLYTRAKVATPRKRRTSHMACPFPHLTLD